MNRSSATTASDRRSSPETIGSPGTRNHSLPLFLAGLLLAFGIATASGSLRWDDPEVFSPEIFPERGEVTETEIFLSGLEALFPRRVFREPPALAAEDVSRREPQSEPLVPGVPYIRVYDLESALPLIEEKGSASTLVIDLRYVEADLDPSLAFASLLARAGSSLEITAIGDHPIAVEAGGVVHASGRRTFEHPFFVLTNEETAGPIEAVLAALKANGDIISVGGSTAGKTGSFRQVSEDPPFYVMSGEIRADPSVSLVETGFVPAVLSRVAPAEDRAGYQALENGVSLDRLVRPLVNRNRYDEAQLLREFNNEEVPIQDQAPQADQERDIPPDATLQRVYHIVKALQSLGRIPGAETGN